ncbi:predicted protein [Naegleria gruberi]|uniref:Predicted protein n=1 Tax=Naegleria gruberi TaxID=5762 RepID=D2VZR8_NAEGR|nr:uncharacterized protein NAEGRDRAFT_53574 [Naegleria gruberi]EFC37748.1 predicted protein [Naegleria gruberi]|eukprot:XP_002670492.1 predicted protein [Naegleria gruberi strain NEG-M]
MGVKPQAPLINGQITEISPNVCVTSLSPNASVIIMRNGTIIGSVDNIDNHGIVWVPFTQGTVLIPGETIIVLQMVNGNLSPEAEATVRSVTTLQPLCFNSPLSTCMQWLILNNMEPGAQVIIRQNLSEIGRRNPAVRSLDYVEVSNHPSAAFSIEAYQQVTTVNGVLTSPSVFSSPIEIEKIPGGGRLPKLEIGGDVHACTDSLDVNNARVTAQLCIENYSGTNKNWWYTILITSGPKFHASGIPHSKKGTMLKIWQQFREECEQISDPLELEVLPQEKPLKPIINAPSGVCLDIGKVFLRNLEQDAFVQFAQWKKNPNGGDPYVQIGLPIIASKTGDDVLILPEFQGITFEPGDRLTAKQIACGEESEYADPVEIHDLNNSGVVGPLVIYEPLYECSQLVSVRGAYPSSSLQAYYSDDDTVGLCDLPVLVDSDNVTLHLSHVLMKQRGIERKVKVKQTGCNADRETEATILDLPHDGLFISVLPEVQKYVRPGANEVLVTNCLPGAKVYILQKSSNTLVANTTSLGDVAIHERVSCNTSNLHLQDGDALFPIQKLCQYESYQNRFVIVATGTMDVTHNYNNWATEPLVIYPQTGGSFTLEVAAEDHDTHENVPIKLLIHRDNMVTDRVYRSSTRQFEIGAEDFFNNLSGMATLHCTVQSEQTSAYTDVKFEVACMFLDSSLHPNNN